MYVQWMTSKFARMVFVVSVASLGSSGLAQPLGTVPFPPENQFSEEKRILGKILFWDEQLSSDNVTSCGTCHIMDAGSADPRLAVNPGQDGLFGTDDDSNGSFGVVDADGNNAYLVNSVFDTLRQVTTRAANPIINSAFNTGDMLWDGASRSQFTDPQTGVVEIASGGGFESQAVGPALNDVEMAHASRDWNQVAAKLTASRPLALATNLTPDQAAAIAASPTYPDLFSAAFGDGAVTAKRIAFAIATYERTLISDQSVFDDAEAAGNDDLFTPLQLDGLNTFFKAGCAVCHREPLFTDNSFRNLGLRPIALDTGRQQVSGLAADRGKFKMPSLRNVGLKSTFMHAGQFITLTEAVESNVPAVPAFPDNVDQSRLGVNLSQAEVPALIEFLATALLDPRVVAETFPFDRPTLRSELPANPIQIGAGDDNGTGFIPTMIANTPPNAGHAEFKVGTTGMTEGTSVTLFVSMTAPVGNHITPDETIGAVATAGSGVAPIATAFWPIADDPALDGQVVYFQWVVDATGARSRVAQATIFCGTGGCAQACLADVNGDGMVTPTDFTAWINAFNNNLPECDQNGDGACTPTDFTAWIANFNAGC